MNRPLVATVAGMTVLGTAVAIYVASPGGGEEEAVQRVATPAAAASTSATPPVLPTASPLPSLPPATSGWLTYADPQGLYSFLYPSGWHVGTGGKRSVILTSWDTATWMSPQFPPDSIKVDVIAAPIEQAEAKPNGASASTLLAGAPGWEIVYTYDPSTMDGVTRAHEIAADHGPYRYFVTGLFAQDHPDDATLLAIASTFRFG